MSRSQNEPTTNLQESTRFGGHLGPAVPRTKRPPNSFYSCRRESAGFLALQFPVMRISHHALVSPRRIENQDPDHFLWGWDFLAENPQRLVTVAANRITQNLLRSEEWPSGEYVGWEFNSASFRKLLEVAEPIFSATGDSPRRAPLHQPGGDRERGRTSGIGSPWYLRHWNR